MSEPKDRDSLRPPAPGAEETVTLRTRVARDAVPDRPGSMRPPVGKSARPAPKEPEPDRSVSARPPATKPPDPRGEDGPGVYQERVRTTADARPASIPEPPPPDRQQRIEALVRELARSGPETDVPLRSRALALGPDALPVLARMFPGALWFDPSRPHRPLRSGREVSAIAACLAAFGEPAVPHVVSLLRAPRPELRLGAALVAADLAHDELVAPLAARLWDEVAAVRNAAMIALRACSALPEMQRMRRELHGTLEDARTPETWRAKAAWTLGQLRDSDAVPLLVDQLAAEPVVARIARRSLVLLIGRDLGRFRVRWRVFLERHNGESRMEWLVDALDQPSAEARMRVVEELLLATGEGFDRRHLAAERETARELAELYRAIVSRQGASR